MPNLEYRGLRDDSGWSEEALRSAVSHATRRGDLPVLQARLAEYRDGELLPRFRHLVDVLKRQHPDLPEIRQAEEYIEQRSANVPAAPVSDPAADYLRLVRKHGTYTSTDAHREGATVSYFDPFVSADGIGDPLEREEFNATRDRFLEAVETREGSTDLHAQARAMSGLAREFRSRATEARSSERSKLNRAADAASQIAQEWGAEADLRTPQTTETRTIMPAYTNPPATYPDPKEVRGVDRPSFFRDLYSAKLGDYGALERLHRNNEERAGDMVSSTSTQGGSFAPPGWLTSQFVEYARPGRVLADLMHHEVLPDNVSSINIPRISGGTSTAKQNTQNTAVADTAATTDAVSGSVVTVAGKQIISQQLIDQSGMDGFDQVILRDLAADYAKQIDALVLASLVGTTGIIAVADSAATLTAELVVKDIGNALSQIANNRFAPATAIAMNPSRWYWLSTQVDSNGRPLVTPSGPGMNQVASYDAAVAQGRAGELMGLPVYVDAQIPDSGTSPAPADAILVLRTDDLWLYESALRLQTFDATYADQLSVLVRAFGYVVGPLVRHEKSIAQVGGSAFSTAPAFA